MHLTPHRLVAAAAAIVIGSSALVAASAASAATSRAHRQSYTVGAATTAGTAKQIRTLVAASTKITKLSQAQLSALPGLATQSADLKFHLPIDCSTVSSCVFGDKASSKVIVLYGDSHARMWMPAIIPAVTLAHERLVVIGRLACPVIDYNWGTLKYANCNAERASALAAIASLHPHSVIVSNWTGLISPRLTSAQWQAAMQATLAQISGKRVVLGDVTQLATSPQPCLAAYPTSVQKCASPNPDAAYPGQQVAEQAAAKAAGALYIDPSAWLCTTSKCSAVIGTFLPYWDSNHVTVKYSAFLAGVMRTALTPML